MLCFNTVQKISKFELWVPLDPGVPPLARTDYSPLLFSIAPWRWVYTVAASRINEKHSPFTEERGRNRKTQRVAAAELYVTSFAAIIECNLSPLPHNVQYVSSNIFLNAGSITYAIEILTGRTKKRQAAKRTKQTPFFLFTFSKHFQLVSASRQ